MIDHLVLAVPDLEAAANWFAVDWGVELQPGGAHPKHGTHNMLLRAGLATYLEVVAADPGAAGERSSRGQAIAAVSSPRLLEFLVPAPPVLDVGVLEGLSTVADTPGSRLRADGALVRWRLVRLVTESGAALPDLITWLSPHPASALPSGVTLDHLTWWHPAGDEIGRHLRSLNARGDIVECRSDPVPRLEAVFATPHGPKSLKG